MKILMENYTVEEFERLAHVDMTFDAPWDPSIYDFPIPATPIDLVEMVLAKSEPAIAQHYDKMLVTDAMALELGGEVRSLHVATENAVLDLTNHSTLSDGKTMLARALRVRNPYVDCLNVLQAETLKRLREAEDGKEDAVLNDALLTTITGIANGMGNTG